MRVKRLLVAALMAVSMILPAASAVAATPDTNTTPDTTSQTTTSPQSTTTTESTTPQDDTATKNDADSQNGSSAQSDSSTQSEDASSPESLDESSDAQDSSASQPSQPQAQERATAPAATGSSDDTSRVSLKIAQLADDNSLSDGKTDYYTFETVDDVVDLDVSGKDYVIDNPYLIIRLTKTNKLENVTFVDSQTGTTERYDDDNYTYVKYTFPTLSGGYHNTYPVSFDFDGHYASNGDQVTMNATLYARDGTVISSSEKTYTAKVTGFDAFSRHGASGFGGEVLDAVDGVAIEKGNPDGLVSNGHRNMGTAVIDSEEDGVTVSGSTAQTNIFASISAKQNGQSGIQGLAYPQNVKIVYTLPENMVITYKEFTRETTYTEETLADGRTRLTAITPTPSFNSNEDYSTNYRKSFRPYVRVGFDNGLPVNTDLPVLIDYYYNVNADGSGGTFIASRNETFFLKPVIFKGTYRFNIAKDGNARTLGNTFYDKFGTVYNCTNHANHHYQYFKGHYYMNLCDVTEPGLAHNIWLSNTNNGSGVSNPNAGGHASTVTEFSLSLDGERAESIKFNGVYVKGFETWKSNAEDEIKNLDSIFEDGNVSLYGVRADGSRKLLKSSVQLREYIKIEEETEREFVSLVFETAKPIVLDNMTLRLFEFTHLTAQGQKDLEAMPEPLTWEYRSSVSAVVDNATATYSGPWNFYNITPLQPKVNEKVDVDKTVAYQEGGTPVDVRVGPDFPNMSDETAAYGPVKTIDNVRTVTILPDGFTFDRWKKAEVGNGIGWVYNTPYYTWKWDGADQQPTVQEIKNYKGTGKTAVVIDYGSIPAAQRAPIDLTLRATKYAKRGQNDVVTYMSYANNDLIRPYGYHPIDKDGSRGPNTYQDALDLDDDGDTTELFQFATSHITYIPPLELMLNTSVSYDGEFSSTVTGDLGYPATYKINAFNNSIKPLDSLSIIDVLPYKGDHTIVANNDGEYPSRGSTYVTGLNGSLEEANPDLSEKFDFYYQLTPQGDAIASVRDGEWLTADQVSDFSQVKSVKMVLKDGQEIASKSEVDIYIPVKVPYDTSLKDDQSEKPDVAVNTAAFALDGRTYSEANSTETYFATYTVTGRMYLDKNKNGTYDEGTDKPLAGRTLKLMEDQAGNTVARATLPGEATNPDGSEISITTDSEGLYSAPVYLRGSYRILATRLRTEKFSENMGGNNNLDLSTASGDTMLTATLALNPVNRTAARDIPVEDIPGSITVQKTSKVEDGNDTAAPLTGAVFRVLKADGSAVTDLDGKALDIATTDANGQLKWENLPLDDYKVVEVTAPVGYTLDNTEHAVTLTREVPDVTVDAENALNRTTVSVTKVWNDDNNRDNLRPDSVTVHLLADNTDTGKTLTLDAAGNWTGSFTGLPTHNNGTAIAYTVTEDEVAHYTAAITGDATAGYIVTNTHTPAVCDITVSKTWDDASNQDGVRPESVTVNLLADNQPATGADGKAITATLNAANEWKYTFSQLPVNNAGQAINYTVTENTVEGYTSEISGDAQAGFVVKNTHTPATVNVRVAKQWVDDNNSKGLRPADVTIQLTADGVNVENQTLTLNEANNWTDSFQDLPKFKAGKEIAYDIAENPVNNYSSAKSGSASAGFTVTNTLTGKITVTAKKQWSGIDADAAPAVTVQLLADGSVVDGKTASLTEDNGWTSEFTDLDQYKAGKEIVYSLAEVGAADGKITLDGHDYEVAIGAIDDSRVITVTNTIVNPTLSVQGSKVWKDADNQDGIRPDAVTVNLTRNGEQAGTNAQVNAESNWKFSFDNLPTYDSKGKAIEYGVTENAVEGYTTAISGSMADGFIVANSHTPDVRSISVSKTWDDADNQDGVRPDSVTVNLLANGEPAKDVDGVAITAVLSASNEWKHTFENLPVNAGGTAINYTVSEDNVEGYSADITGSADAGFEVKNTHTPATVDVPVTKQWIDDDNAKGLRPDSVTIQLTADGAAVEGQKLTLDDANNWTDSFKDLPKFKQGKAIVYDVEEATVNNYSSAKTGTAETGFTVTNTIEGKVSVGVTKQWSGIDADAAPDVQMQLLANGEAVDGQVVKLNQTNEWKHTFTDLDQFKDGKEIAYTVEEVGAANGKITLAGHEYTVSVEGSAASHSFTFTNTMVNPLISFEGTKVWDDADNQDGIRSDSVTMVPATKQ